MAKPIIPSESWIASDFSPETFGRLTTISSPYKPEGAKSPVQDFVCSCGKKVTKPVSSVRSGNTSSCGCIKKEILAKKNKENAKHGYFGTPTYRSWSSMIVRCEDTSHVAYHNYGGRGIKIDQELRTFEGFLKYLGERPTKEHTLDRIDVNGNYEPGNVRWATRKEQSTNKRNTINIRVGEESGDLNYWHEKTGISKGALHYRISKGWTPEQVLGLAVRPRSRTIYIEYRGRRLSTYEWSKEIGVSASVIKQRLREGRPIDEVLSGNNQKIIYLEALGERLTLAEWSKRTGLPVGTLRHRIYRNWNPHDVVSRPYLSKTPIVPLE
jgi:hypothetical protein